MELIDGSETSAFKNQPPGKHPKDYSQYSKHGESMKSRTQEVLFINTLVRFNMSSFCYST
jgi:hypothetical protein